MKITAYDLKKLGIIDHIIPEPRGGAHRNVKKQAAYLDEVVAQSLQMLEKYSVDELLEKRWKNIRKLGNTRQFD